MLDKRYQSRKTWRYQRVTGSMTETKVCTHENKLYWQYPRNLPIQSRDRHVLLAGGPAGPRAITHLAVSGGHGPHSTNHRGCGIDALCIFIIASSEFPPFDPNVDVFHLPGLFI